MSEISLKNLNSNITAGDKTLADISVRGLIASDLPVSEIVGTLTKRVRIARTQTERWNYIINKIYFKNIYFDGMIDVNYTEYKTDASTNPYDDVTIDDFNAGLNKSIRFTYEAKTQSNLKTKILSQKLMNFKTQPNDAITAIYSDTTNISKQQEIVWANRLWSDVNERAYLIDTTDLEDVASSGDSVNKLIYETLLKFQTTQKNHIGTGTDLTIPGVITKDDVSVNPSNYFNSNEFYMIQNISFKSNTKFDGEKVFLNWGGSDLNLAGVFTMDFANAEEIPSDIKSQYSKISAILLHKDAIHGIEEWEGTGASVQIKLYSVFHNYIKFDTYPIYDKPIIVFGAKSTSTLTKKKSK